MTCRALHREDLHRYQMTPSTQASTGTPTSELSDISCKSCRKCLSDSPVAHCEHRVTNITPAHPRKGRGQAQNVENKERLPNQESRSKSKDGRSNTNTTSHVRGTHTRNRNWRFRTRAHAHHSSSIVGTHEGAPRLRHRLGRFLYAGSSHA